MVFLTETRYHKNTFNPSNTTQTDMVHNRTSDTNTQEYIADIKDGPARCNRNKSYRV